MPVPHHHNVDISKTYKLGDELGSGSFSVVKLATHKETGKKYADKIISKVDGPGASEKGMAMIEIEIEVLRRAKHSSIIGLHEIFENEKEIHLILDMLAGGELFDQIVTLSCYTEENASKVVRQLTEAIQHLHLKKVVHRDLKPENLLLKEKSAKSDVMLADFGLAALMDSGTKLKTAVGTPGYIAPEVLLTLDDEDITYDYQVDIFGIGVIMYILLCGFPPFYADDDDTLFDLTIDGDYSFPSPYWDNISIEAKDLIDHLLVTDPDKRYNCHQILTHPWLTTKNKTEPMPMAQEQLKAMLARKRWKKGINTIIAAQKFNFGKSLLAAAKKAKAEEEAQATKQSSNDSEKEPAAPAVSAISSQKKSPRKSPRQESSDGANKTVWAPLARQQEEKAQGKTADPKKKRRFFKRKNTLIRNVGEAVGSGMKAMFGKKKSDKRTAV